jgi:hypothetical protein
MANGPNFLKMARVLTSLPSAGTIALHGKGLIHDEKKVITPARSTQGPRSEPVSIPKAGTPVVVARCVYGLSGWSFAKLNSEEHI